jgi:hypothetical protein
MSEPKEFDCGLEGEDEDAVQVGRFNRWLLMGMRHHLIPMKAELTAARKELSEHILEDKLMQAQILGGIRVLKWMIPAIAVILPSIVLFILYLMHKGGVI